MNHLPVLKVKLFGKESVSYGDTVILGGKNTIPKLQKLMLILLNAGKNGITKRQLLENLYGGEELADSLNYLRVTFFRLKKVLLERGLPEYDYIVLKEGKYYWQCPMEMEIDTEKFEELIVRAEKQQDQKKEISLLKEACRLYSGEFLQRLSGEEWVLWESIEYKQMYYRSLEIIFTYLLEKKEYQEALELADTVCALYPLDEWQSVKIECYIGMNRLKEALQEYENTARLLAEELGVSPSEKMMKQFELMSGHISNQSQIIGEIKNGLREKKMESGAFFCSLPSFRDAYRILRRAMERNGQSIYLLLCTLVDGKGRPMRPSERRDLLSEELFVAIQTSLRRCDSFTRYNHSQYLIMLMGTNEENCQIVEERIRKRFGRQHKNWEKYLEYSVSSLYDSLGLEGEEELF